MSIESCPKCAKLFETDVIYYDKTQRNRKYKIKFCSKKCANSHVCTEQRREKLRQTYKHLYSSGKLSKGKDATKWESRICLICAKEFEVYKKSNKKYCSLKCGTKNCGGYRHGSGRSKSGYYKEIYCGSTYELVWAIYRFDHGLPVNRFPDTLRCKETGKKYMPDFFEGKVIYEIKGWERDDSVALKTKIAESYGYTVKVLRKDDLKVEFKWVEEKYNLKNDLQILYDDFKPKYEYTCNYCKKHFFRERKRKSDYAIKYCSRSCAGKSNKKE